MTISDEPGTADKCSSLNANLCSFNYVIDFRNRQDAKRKHVILQQGKGILARFRCHLIMSQTSIDFKQPFSLSVKEKLLPPHQNRVTKQCSPAMGTIHTMITAF